MEALITHNELKPKDAATDTAPEPAGRPDPLDSERLRAEANLAWHNEQLRQAQAQLLLDGSRLAALLTLLAAPLLAYLLLGNVPGQPLLLWSGGIVALSLVRFFTLTQRHRFPLSQRQLPRARRTVLVWNCISGLAWGSSAFLIYPPDGLPQQAVLLLTLAGVVAIAVTVHSGMLDALAAFVLPATLPVIVRLLMEGTPLHNHMAALTALFLLITSVIAWKIHRITLSGIRVSVQNENLFDHLEQAKSAADKLNVELRREIAERRSTEAQLRQERDFISGVLDTETAIVVVMDLEGKILRFNLACESSTGYYAHEVIGEIFWETLLPEDQATRFRQYFRAVADGFFPVECEIHWRRKDSGTRLVKLSNTAILGQDGKCTHVVATGIDITDRRQAEAALAQTQENFELLVEGVTDYAILMLDQDGTIISWNAGAQRISGYTIGEAIGAHFSELFHPADQRHDAPRMELRIAAADGHYHREGWHATRNGSRYWATLNINPVRGSGNELRGFSVIINDITARKNTEDTIRSLLTITERLNESLDLDRIMEALVREAVRLVQAESGYAGLVEGGRISVTPYLSGDSLLPLDTTPSLDSMILPGHVLASQRLYRSNNARDDHRVSSYQRAMDDIRTLLCAPIIDANGEILGFLEVHNKKGGEQFSEDDARRLESAANTAALAIRNAKSYLAIKDAEALLSDETAILEGIAQHLPLASVLQTIVNVAETRCEALAACVLERHRWHEQRNAICSPSIQGMSTILSSLVDFPDAQLRSEATDALGLHNISTLLETDSALNRARTMGYQHAYVCHIGDDDSQDLSQLILLSVDDAVKNPRTLSVLEKIRHLAGIALERWSTEQGLLIRDQAIRSSTSAILLIDNRDDRFTVMYANDAAGNLLGSPAAQLTGSPLVSLLTDAGGKKPLTIVQALHLKQHAYTTIKLTQDNQDTRWIEVYVTPVRSRDSEIQHSIAIINDISERKQAESDLAQSREQLRSLSSHLQNVREEEKASLARELHDELGSMLTALKIEVSTLGQQLSRLPDLDQASVDAIVMTVNEAISTTRRISTNLRPPILDNLGLSAAVEWQLNQFKRVTGLEVELHVTGDSTDLDDQLTIAIFRILQEGLTNIARHAQASQVSVAVAISEYMAAMDLIDDGAGFSISEHETGSSYGLYSMQERARALGGSVDIISQPGEGTRLKVRVPLTAHDNPIQ